MTIVIPVITAFCSAIACAVACLSFMNHRFDRRFALLREVTDAQDQRLRQEVMDRVALDARLHGVEVRMSMMPTAARVDQLIESMTALSVRLVAVEVSSQATSDGVRTIQNYLLAEKGKT